MIHTNAAKRVAETIILFFIMGFIVAAGNALGSKLTKGGGAIPLGVSFIDSLKGVLLIAAIASTGYLISLLPILRKVPQLFWIASVAVYVSSVGFWWHEEVVKITSNVAFLSTCTPVLALAGLAIGKDLHLFKMISWRIIPVALAVFSGTFIFAAVLAHFALKFEGAIP